MFDLLKTRLLQGHQTSRFPHGKVDLPERFRGRPRIDRAQCTEGCTACSEACPTDAIARDPLTVDLGKCLFCASCAEACPRGALVFSRDHRLATRTRADLVVGDGEAKLAAALDAKQKKLFGRSLKLRQVSAGGCNGCEAELVATGNVVFDLNRFGIDIVASPRHADGIVVTGPVSLNMESALLATYAAVPAPKLVIAVGACAIGGGPFAGGSATRGGVAGCSAGGAPALPVDLYVPGCPPHPLTFLDGMLRLLGAIEG